MKVMLKNVKLAFANAVFEARGVNGGPEAFSVTSILPTDHPQIKEIEEATDQVGQDKWRDKWEGIKKQLTAQSKLPLKDGDMKAQYEGFAGNLFISSRSSTRPVVVDGDKTPLVEADGKIYSGCVANVAIEIWAQDNQYGKRINTKLRGIQFVEHGDAFGSGAAMNDDEFEVVTAANFV